MRRVKIESGPDASANGSPVWETLEAWVRQRIQGFIQAVLEEELTEALGRGRHERRGAVDAPEGYRNGYGKPRRLTLSGGTVTIRRPRARGLEERFMSRILPLFARRTREVGELLPELYLHGLSEGDFDLALRGLLGEGAALSVATLGRLKERWHAEYAQWNERPLGDLEVAYLWADGIYVKAGLEKSKACLLVLIAGLCDGRKVVLAVEDGFRESKESWQGLLRRLRERGMGEPRCVVGDGALGLWAALDEVFPQAAQQRCWNHKTQNVLDKLPKKSHAEAKRRVREIAYADSRRQAEHAKARLQTWARQNGWDSAADTLDRDWERMVTFYDFPKEHWRHLRTTNIVESPFAAVRLRTNVAKRYKKVARATAVIWKTLLVAEKHFRRLNAPERLKEVYEGVQYQDGHRVEAAAA